VFNRAEIIILLAEVGVISLAALFRIFGRGPRV
jgi:hypothetical protein